MSGLDKAKFLALSREVSFRSNSSVISVDISPIVFSLLLDVRCDSTSGTLAAGATLGSTHWHILHLHGWKFNRNEFNHPKSAFQRKTYQLTADATCGTFTSGVGSTH